MRTLVKVFSLGMVLSALAIANAGAGVQQRIGTGLLTDGRSPNASWKLYTGSFHAGDTIQASWTGFSHLRLSLYDRVSGQPALDGQGNPIVAQYNGNIGLNATNSVSLSIPVDVADGVLVVKNPEAAFGYVFYQLFGPNAITSVPTSVPFIYNPSFSKDPTTHSITVSFPIINMGLLPIWGVKCDMMIVSTVDGSWISMPGNGMSWNIAPHGSVTDSMTCPDIAGAVGLIVSQTAYGETFVARYNFFVP